jgi:hypothetical protein
MMDQVEAVAESAAELQKPPAQGTCPSGSVEGHDQDKERSKKQAILR